MPLLTFTPPVAPSIGTDNTPEFKILEAEFGDGYSQPAADGFNNVRNVVGLGWDTLTPDQSAPIMAFLKARRGYEPFLYQSVFDAAPVRWTCKEVSERVIEGGFRAVRATLKRDFNLSV